MFFYLKQVFGLSEYEWRVVTAIEKSSDFQTKTVEQFVTVQERRSCLTFSVVAIRVRLMLSVVLLFELAESLSPKNGKSPRHGILALNTYFFTHCSGGLLCHLWLARGGICQHCLKRSCSHDGQNSPIQILQPAWFTIFLVVCHQWFNIGECLLMLGMRIFRLSTQNNSSSPILLREKGSWVILGQKKMHISRQCGVVVLSS